MNAELTPDLAPRDAGRSDRSRGRPTPAWVVFDLLVGIVLPLLCLGLDPLVFRDGFSRAMFGGIRLAAYGFFGIEMVSLVLWLTFGERLGRFAELFAGVLFAGAVSAGLLGLVLLPFALIGLLALIGVLGLSPLPVAWVYLRNARAAARVGGDFRNRTLGLAVVGGLLACGLPILSQVAIARHVSQLLSMAIDGDESASSRAIERLVNSNPILCATADLDALALEYGDEDDPRRRGRIATAYAAVASDTIEDRLNRLND